MINKFQQGGSAQLQLIIMKAALVLQSEGYNIVDGSGNLDLKTFILAVADYGQKKLGVQVTQQNIGQVITAIALQGAQMARQGTKLNYLKKLTNNCPEGTQLTYYKVGGQICSKCEAIQRKQNSVNVMDGIKKEMFMDGGKAKPIIHRDDTVHINGKPYTLLNSDGSPTIKNSPFPKYTSEQWKKDANSKDPEAKRRAAKQDSVTSEKKGAKITAKACPKCGKVHAGKCGSKLVKKKKCACGTKIEADKCGKKIKKKCSCGTKIKIQESKCGSKMKKAKKHELGGILTAMQKLKNGGSLNGIPFKN